MTNASLARIDAWARPNNRERVAGSKYTALKPQGGQDCKFESCTGIAWYQNRALRGNRGSSGAKTAFGESAVETEEGQAREQLRLPWRREIWGAPDGVVKIPVVVLPGPPVRVDIDINTSRNSPCPPFRKPAPLK